MKKLSLLIMVFVFSVFTLGCDSVTETEVGPEVFNGPTVDQCDDGAAGSITFRVGDGNPRTLCADEPGKFAKPGEMAGLTVYLLNWKNPLNEKESMRIMFGEMGGEVSKNLIIEYLHESAPETTRHEIGYSGSSENHTTSIDGRVVKGTFSDAKLQYGISHTEVNVIEVSGEFNITVEEASESDIIEMNGE